MAPWGADPVAGVEVGTGAKSSQVRGQLNHGATKVNSPYGNVGLVIKTPEVHEHQVVAKQGLLGVARLDCERTTKCHVRRHGQSCWLAGGGTPCMTQTTHSVHCLRIPNKTVQGLGSASSNERET